MQPNAPNPAPDQPIHDVAPPRDSPDSPEGLADIPVRPAPGKQLTRNNHIAGTAPLSHPDPAPAEAGENEEPDKTPKDVNKNVKVAIQKNQRPPKPVLAITVAILAGLALSVAAFFAFRTN